VKILLVANLAGGWPYIQELKDNLSKSKLEVDIFDSGNNELITCSGQIVVFFRHHNWRYILKIPILRNIINRIRTNSSQFAAIKAIISIQNSYDIIEFHYVATWQYFLLKKLKNYHKVILFYWGSDLYEDKYYIKKPTHDLSGHLVFATKSMASDFLKLCGNDNLKKIHYLHFGVTMLEFIKEIEAKFNRKEIKRHLGISEDSFIITCGHNGYELMQHETIIENINKVKESLPVNYILVFPFAYRFNEEYYQYIKRLLESYRLNFKFIIDFMTMQDVARLRLITDVHINFVTSDGLNASMLENLYANSVVINGDWLKYDTLNEMNIYCIQAERESLYQKIDDVSNNYSFYLNKSANNKSIIYDHFAWGNAIKNWLKLYREITEAES
jgi:glycosyltransferase involved in cell wall biosynthesis